MARSPITESPRFQAVHDGPSDRELITRSDTDPTAFEQFYERHHSAVFRYAAARVGSASADDLVAETFLAAYKCRARFEQPDGGNALPWLLGIATRRLGRHRDGERRWLRDRAAAISDGDRLPEPLSIEERVDAARLAPYLATALGQLHARERDPLLLHVLAGLSYEEVATALELPIGTVRSRISRARTRLAGILDGVPR